MAVGQHAAVVLVFFESFFDGEGGFAFAFEVFARILLLVMSMVVVWREREKTHDARPAPEISLLDHQVRALFVVERVSGPVGDSGGDNRNVI